ncbi:hypothetical protein [Stakelama marina]|uniref:Lipoprotein n=1 Tax=Stakelama marina TaxID=2826939 RepID=A0A8T4IFB1_9SPHN|nr:hypothetical protein [Stakelama marina]MBR0553250.1 hypothetical protein [Stakelama marina]
MRQSLYVVPFALLLAACNGSSDGDATNVTFSAKGEGGNMTATADENGRVSFKLPGFEGSIKLPKFRLDADNFDLNGVKLYPGTKITAFNVDANSGDGGNGPDRVHVRFDSPASPQVVHDWLKPKLIDAGYSLEDSGAGLSGKTDDGDNFRLELSPTGQDRTAGVITIED